MTLRSDARDWLLLLVPGLIWGASFLFIAEGLEAVGPFGVTFTRILVGFVTLSLFDGARASVPREDWGRIALLAVVWMAFPLSMFPFAEQRVTSALTGMLNGAVPLTTAVVASVIARAAPPRGVLVGVVVGLAGAVLMALPSLGEGRSSVVGIGLVVAAVISYGFALNVARPLQLRHGALPVIWRAQAVALVLTAPMGAPQLLAGSWSWVPALSLLALGALGTGVAYVVATIASGHLGAARASASAFLIPPVALVLGVLLRDESVAPLAVLGGGVCVAGAWVMRRAQTGSASRGDGAIPTSPGAPVTREAA